MVPDIPFTTKNLEAFPKTSSRVVLNQFIEGLNDLRIPLRTLGGLVVGRLRKPNTSTAPLDRQAVLGNQIFDGFPPLRRP